MSNLLQETLDILQENAKTTKQVVWVGSANGNFAISWDAFVELANFEYDDGYGGQVIASDLVVVGKGWWLERHEYDGSERWKFKTLPALAASPKKFSKLTAKLSPKTLQELNKQAVL